MSDAVERAVKLGCTTFQIFPSNPRGWEVKDLDEEEVRRFRDLIGRYGIKKFFVHMPYLPNIAAPPGELRYKSAAAFARALRRTEALGGYALITHMGSHKGAGVHAGVAAAGAAITHALTETGVRANVLMENSAGKSNQIGTNFTELVMVYEAISPEVRDRVGVCYDTCHAHAMGYDISKDPSGFERALNELAAGMGEGAVELVHLNDSLTAAGSMLDRHANLGKGTVGRAGLRAFVNHPYIRDRNVPICLETPEGDVNWPKELALVKKWATS